MKRKGECNNIPRHIAFKRTFAHADGNWPTFVYIPVLMESRGICQIFNKCIHHFLDTLSVDGNQISTDASTTHISLSRTFTLQYHQIEPFIDALGKAFLSKIQFIVGLISEYHFLENEDKSRSFLCLPVNDRANKITDFIQCTDKVLIKFSKNSDVFYKDPKFHISIASMLPTALVTRNQSNDIEDVYSVDQSYESKMERSTYFSVTKANNHENSDSSDSDDDAHFRSIKTTSKNKGVITTASNNNNNNNHVSETGTSSIATVANDADIICSKLNLLVKCIECKIGDRLFRLQLRNSATATVTTFSEVLI